MPARVFCHEDYFEKRKDFKNLGVQVSDKKSKAG
jgi:hypothetical protein